MSASIRRILEVIEMTPSVSDGQGVIDLRGPIKGLVEMKDVSFSYCAGNTVLQKLNMKLEAGEKVALVGISGSGKSTIAKLIARLYETEFGSVCIDGIDVRNVRLESLRTRACYLMQEGILFDRTLKENLLLGRPSATVKELHLSIEIADLEGLLQRLPKGWDTPVGPRGNLLSGGERQRVALSTKKTPEINSKNEICVLSGAPSAGAGVNALFPSRDFSARGALGVAVRVGFGVGVRTPDSHAPSNTWESVQESGLQRSGVFFEINA
jgi:ABC-type transport system involved in Fe-S cluster assembly fused permease/ATPase subunit